MNKIKFQNWLKNNLKEQDVVLIKNRDYNGPFQVIGPAERGFVPILLSQTCRFGNLVSEYVTYGFITNCNKYMNCKFIRVPLEDIVGIVRKLPKKLL